MSSLTRISITRHGEGEHNLRTTHFQGRAPTAGLTATGHEQARRLGQRLLAEQADLPSMPITHLVCSSLLRTTQTAQEIGTLLGQTPEGDDAFWELSKGEWEGVMPINAVPEPEAQALAADPFGFRYPGGESYEDVWRRTAPAFERWVRRAKGGRLLLVLHGDVIRALLYHILRFPPTKIGDFHLDPCSLTEFRQEGERLVMLSCNDTAHLR